MGIVRISSFLFQLMFFSQVIFGDDFLSKFHQHGFKIKEIRMQLMSFDQNYFNFFQIKAFKYNRTTTAHNLTLNYKVDVEDKLLFLVQIFKFVSNQYREVPMRFQMNAAKAFKANIGGITSMAECGNLRNGFTFFKNVTYKICNFVVDENQLPPLVPDGKYQAKVQFYISRMLSQLCMCFVKLIPQ